MRTRIPRLAADRASSNAPSDVAHACDLELDVAGGPPHGDHVADALAEERSPNRRSPADMAAVTVDFVLTDNPIGTALAALVLELDGRAKEDLVFIAALRL